MQHARFTYPVARASYGAIPLLPLSNDLLRCTLCTEQRACQCIAFMLQPPYLQGSRFDICAGRSISPDVTQRKSKKAAQACFLHSSAPGSASWSMPSLHHCLAPSQEKKRKKEAKEGKEGSLIFVAKELSSCVTFWRPQATIAVDSECRATAGLS